MIGFIEPQIRKAEIERARRKRPEVLDAWDLYVQALPLVHSGVVANLGRAIELLSTAIEIDPGYAPALALAAWAHHRRHSFGGPSLRDYETDPERAIELAKRTVEADPDDALALALKGWLRIHYRLDFSCLELVRRAVALNPNNTSVGQETMRRNIGEHSDVARVCFGRWSKTDGACCFRACLATRHSHLNH